MIHEAVNIKTPDGNADATVTRPETNVKRRGILVLTDIMGDRPAYSELADRIASHDYVVLTPNIFYRWGKPPVFDFPVDWEKEETTKRRQEIMAPLTTPAIDSDCSTYLDFLSGLPSVRGGLVGVVGFCLTGRWALRLAALRADRIGAAASFHGGGLYTEDADSPHLLLPRVKAKLYFGHAENDRSMPADAIEKFETALDGWGDGYESETYPAGHGWMISGRPVYDEAQADRGFAKMIELFDSALK